MSKDSVDAYMASDDFHHTDYPVCKDQDSRYFRSHQSMAKVRYTPAHYNPNAPQGMQGQGSTLGTWVYNEEQDKGEGVLQSGIELMMDSTLEANASVGLHQHQHTEELYYLIEGQLDITLYTTEGIIQQCLTSGDSHRIAPGQSHFIQAGKQGARFIVVAAKVKN